MPELFFLCDLCVWSEALGKTGQTGGNTMTFEEHYKESKALFGKSYEEVRKWLDEFAGAAGISPTREMSSFTEN